jgi:hypothetical protein
MVGHGPAVKLTPLAFAVALLPLAGPAGAGESACLYEEGVLVVPASVAGMAGDYILDTATPATVVHETRAQANGVAEAALSGEVELAGLRLAARPVAVVDIDLRTWNFPTPIAGVIGADVLKDFIVDVQLSPCRLRLSRAEEAPAFRVTQSLPLRWKAGRPTVPAAVADGPHARAGDFAPATGADTAIRLSDAVAAAPGAAKPQELYPGGVLRPRLRALSFAGELSEQLPAGLIKAEAGGPDGEIGAAVLAAWRMRFDFPAGRLLLTPAAKPGDVKEKGPPDRSGGP